MGARDPSEYLRMTIQADSYFLANMNPTVATTKPNPVATLCDDTGPIAGTPNFPPRNVTSAAGTRKIPSDGPLNSTEITSIAPAMLESAFVDARRLLRGGDPR